MTLSVSLDNGATIHCAKTLRGAIPGTFIEDSSNEPIGASHLAQNATRSWASCVANFESRTSGCLKRWGQRLVAIYFGQLSLRFQAYGGHSILSHSLPHFMSRLLVNVMRLQELDIGSIADLTLNVVAQRLVLFLAESPLVQHIDTKVLERRDELLTLHHALLG